MPFVLGFLGFVVFFGLCVGLYALVSNPNRKMVQLDANHFDMATLLGELLAIDRGGVPIFPSESAKSRAEQYVLAYRESLTNRKEISR